MNDTVATLTDLHTSLVDAVKGYDEAVSDAEAPEMSAQFAHMRSLHAEAVHQISGILDGLGISRNEDGSFMSTVHRTVISLRSMVTGLGPNSLPAFISGEQLLLEKYGKAIVSGVKSADEAILVAQSDRLSAAIRQMQEKVPA